MLKVILSIIVSLCLITNSFAQFIGLGIRLSYNHPLNLSTLAQLQSFGGLTFYKNYALNQASANADFSVGSATATVTSARSATAPATYYDSAGLIHTLTTANVPRWTQGFYDSTGFHLAPGILIESGGGQLQGENVVLDSTAFTAAAWTVSSLTAADSVTDGVLSATVSTLTSNLSPSNIVQAVVDASAGKYTASVFIKRKTGTGTVSLRANTLDSYTDITSQVTSVWTRVQVTSSSAINPSFDLQLGTNGDVVYVYGAQLEKFPYMTSFIPTPAGARTRATEQLSYVITGNRTAAQESLFIKFIPLYSNFVNDSIQRTMTDTDTKSRTIAKISSSGQTRFLPNSTDNAAVLANTVTVPNAGSSYIIAATAQPTAPYPYASAYFNGTNEGTYLTGAYTTNSWGTNFYIGGRSSASSGQLNGIIQSAAFYSTLQQDPSVNHISHILSPDTTPYHNYIFTASNASGAGLVSGSAGNGNVIANTDYLWHDHYICADSGWTEYTQSCNSVLFFQRNGPDDAGGLPGQIYVRTFTKSTKTFGATSLVWGDGTTIQAGDFQLHRNPGENFIRLYIAKYMVGNLNVNSIVEIKSTDLTGSSWGSEIPIRTGAPGAFGGWLHTSTAGTDNLVLVNDFNGGGKFNLFQTSDGGDTFTATNTVFQNANMEEGACVNEYSGPRIICVLRNQNGGSGDFLNEVTSSNYGQNWGSIFPTNIGSGTGIIVTPALTLSSGNLANVTTYFYDRGDARLKISTSTSFNSAFTGSWLPIYLIGVNSQGNGNFYPIDFTLHWYLISTATSAEPTNSVNWWVFQDLYTWVQQ